MRYSRLLLLVPAFTLAAGFSLFANPVMPPRYRMSDESSGAGANTAVTPRQAPAQGWDQSMRLIAEARQAFQGVRDYSCLFIKRENVNGQLQPENWMTMKVRNQPFSVALKWLGPDRVAGQEVIYVAGKNNGMMRVHSAGIFGAVGFVNVDPRDPRAVRESRHSITDAGIGNLIERLGKCWAQECRANLTQVRIADYDYDKKRCTRVETIQPADGAGKFYCWRTVVYFDKESKLPIRLEVYDFPKRGGNPNGDLLEMYSYTDLRLNVGLGDDAFNK